MSKTKSKKRTTKQQFLVRVLCVVLAVLLVGGTLTYILEIWLG